MEYHLDCWFFSPPRNGIYYNCFCFIDFDVPNRLRLTITLSCTALFIFLLLFKWPPWDIMGFVFFSFIGSILISECYKLCLNCWIKNTTHTFGFIPTLFLLHHSYHTGYCRYDCVWTRLRIAFHKVKIPLRICTIQPWWWSLLQWVVVMLGQ